LATPLNPSKSSESRQTKVWTPLDFSLESPNLYSFLYLPPSQIDLFRIVPRSYQIYCTRLQFELFCHFEWNDKSVIAQ